LSKTGSTRDEAISVEDGENVVTAGALLLRLVDYPAVVEAEHLPQELAVPGEVAERRNERRGTVAGRGSRSLEGREVDGSHEEEPLRRALHCDREDVTALGKAR